jgi:predicted phage-related endonuclease
MITVGSSDVPAILGLSPWSSPSHTWARLVGLIPRYDSGGTAQTRRGHMLEGALLDEWARRKSPLGRTKGPSLDEAPAVREGWKAARVDMLAVLEDGPCVVEAKTTRTWDGWGDDGSASPPLYYVAQVAWQLHVLDVPRAELIAYNAFDDRIRIYPMERNEAVEGQLVAAIEQWMQRHVWANPVVPPSDLPMDVIEVLHRDGGGTKHWIDPDDELRKLAEDLAHAREVLTAAEAREQALKAQLCDRIGSAYGIRGVATWGQVKGRETVAVSDLKAAYPDVYAKLAKRSGGHRMFRFIYKQETE